VEPSLRGLYVPLITPFTDDGHLAPDVLEKLAFTVLDSGAAGLVALGATGEHATLSDAERQTVIGICARVCAERDAALIVGAGSAGSAGPDETVGTARELRELAAWPEVSAALAVVPGRPRSAEKGVVAHFTRLAADSPVPLIVDNSPGRAGRALGGQTLLRLASLPGISGIRHAVGAVDHDTITLMAARPDDFAVLAGDDVFASPLLALGADGGMLASASVCTAEFATLVAAWHYGHVEEARDLGYRLFPLSAALSAEPSPAVVKGVLHAQGKIPSPAVRLPLVPARQDTIRAAATLLTRL
jgi:4-hydroxy-tetrahydrodipicolinate synthase